MTPNAMFLTPEGFSARDLARPACGADEVIVRSLACGVCEGDTFRYRMRHESPVDGQLIGHEGTGVVCEVGKNVRSLAVGDKVTALGGTYSAYFKATPDELVKLPDNLRPEDALGEPVACFVHAAGRFGIVPGDKVAIIGCGYMGLGCLQMAKLQGATTLVAIEPLAWRRDAASRLGATKTVDPSGKTPETLLKELGEFDVVIEATGAAPVVDTCTALVREHGKIILVGYHQSEKGLRTVDMKTWNYKAIDVINGHVRDNKQKLEAMRKGMQLQGEGKLRFDGLLRSYPLSEIETAFRDLMDRKEGLFKAVLTFA